MNVKMDKPILDACCGGRTMWFDKTDPRALFIDIRRAPKGLCPERPEFCVEPDMIADFRDLPFPDRSFKLIAWDPPHLLHLGETSRMCKKYGSLKNDTWRWDMSQGFNELWRVLDVYGTLVMKWNERDIPLNELFKCFKEKPLFGHTLRSKSKTHWMCWLKIPGSMDQEESKEKDETIAKIRCQRDELANRLNEDGNCLKCVEKDAEWQQKIQEVIDYNGGEWIHADDLTDLIKASKEKERQEETQQ